MGRSSCPLGGIVTEAHGFAVLSAQRSEGLTVGVSLQGGAANDTYTVHLIECKGGSELPGPTTVGTFETDANGSGTFFGDHVDKRAADHAFVGLIDDSRTSIFATAVVPI
jgi:hypothetical protein